MEWGRRGQKGQKKKKERRLKENRNKIKELFFHSKNASELGTPVPALPRGGVGGLSSLIEAIQVSKTEKLPPPAPPPEPEAPPSSPSSLITPPSPEASPPANEPDLFGEVGVGGRGWMSLGTMTRSRPRTRMAPVFLSVLGRFFEFFESFRAKTGLNDARCFGDPKNSSRAFGSKQLRMRS